MEEIFNNYIENSFIEYEQCESKIEKFIYNYKKYFPNDGKASLLDIGIGRGEMLSCMKKWGYKNYLGVDISPSTIDFCKKLGLNCDLVDDTIDWLLSKESAFDLITLLDVLEHFEKKDVIPLLKILYKALKPGGKIIIQVPNLQAPDGQLHMYNDFTHNSGFIEHSLQQVLIVAGINNIEFHGFEEIVRKDIKDTVKKCIRSLYWKYCRFIRRVNTNLSPEILNPVFYVVITK